MSRTKKFVGGITVGYVHQAMATIVGLWLTPFFLSRLGAHDYGLWLTGMQVIAYLALLDLGVLALLPREAAYATGRAGSVQQATDLPDVIGRTANIVLWQLPLISLATLVAWWYLPVSWRGLQWPLAMLFVAFILTYPLRMFQATLQGLQDLAFLGSMQLVAWAAGTLTTIVLVLDGWGLSALAAGAILTQVVALGGSGLRVVSRYGAALPRALPWIGWREAKPHLSRAIWISISQISHVMLYATDLVIVAAVFGPVTVVPYACTQKLISVLANQPQIVAQTAAPALSELRASGSRQRLFSVTSSLSLGMMLASGAVLVVVLAVNRSFVSWWVGADLYGGALLTGVFAAAMLARHWNTALIFSLFAFGRERRISVTNAIDGVATLAMSLTLARLVGVIGVPLGFLAGALLVSIPANLRALGTETDVPVRQFLTALVPWCARLALLLPLALLTNLAVRSPHVVVIVLVSGSAAAAYLMLMLPIAFRPPLGDYISRGFAPVAARLGLGGWMARRMASASHTPQVTV